LCQVTLLLDFVCGSCQNLHHGTRVTTAVQLLLVQVHEVSVPGQELGDVVNCGKCLARKHLRYLVNPLGSKHILSELS
jgi:hypothetical protein